MGNPVVWFEVIGADASKVRDFYGGVFEWDIKPSEQEGYQFVETGEGNVPGGIGAGPPGMPGHATFYVQVESLEDSLQKIESAGGKTVAPPMDVMEGVRIAVFHDPDGNTVGLFQGTGTTPGG
jgi:uncharacterized protein